MPRTLAGQKSERRPPLSLRTTESLRQRLEENATRTGRSLAQEVEFRLERSFDRNATVQEAFGSGHVDLLRALHVVFEYRFADGSAGPYIAAVATIIGAMDGQKLEAPLDEDELAFISRVGMSLATPKDKLTGSAAEARAKGVLPRAISCLRSGRAASEPTSSSRSKRSQK